jgi:uroporphyrinogen decarboxylase
MSAVTGTDADHQPFTMLLSLYGANFVTSDIRHFYRNPATWFEGQRKVVELFDPDILITPFSFPLEAEAFGSELVFIPQYAPNIKKPILTDLSQIKNMAIPDVQTSPNLQFFLQSATMLTDEYKGTKAIGAPLHSPCDLPALLMGIEMWIDTLLFHPAEAEMLLEKTVEHFVNLGNEFFDRGATFLIIPLNFTNPLIITERILLRLLPYLQKAFAQMKGPIVIHNGGCVLQPFLSHFAKLPNVIAFVLDPREKFADARSIIGNDIVLMGNLDGPNIHQLIPQQVQEKCLKILTDRKDDKHFIFATSNADIAYHTSIENLKMVKDTIRNFKKSSLG